MKLLGDANWWLPRWLDRILPNLDIEGETSSRPPSTRTTCSHRRHAPASSSLCRPRPSLQLVEAREGGRPGRPGRRAPLLERGDAFGGFGRSEEGGRDPLGLTKPVVDAQRRQVDEEALRRRHCARLGLAHRMHDLGRRGLFEPVGLDDDTDESGLASGVSASNTSPVSR